MKRRTFLEVVGAVTSLEITRPDTVTTDSGTSEDSGADLAALATSLPAASDLTDESSFGFSVTRLDNESVSTTTDLVADGTVYATVFSGPVATDVVFGLPNVASFKDRLATGGYDALAGRDGWSLFRRRQRTRHRMVAVGDSAAIIGVGPDSRAVANDVRETMDAIDGRNDPPDESDSDRAAIVERLGQGTHVTVDMSPDSRQTGESVVATGRRFEVRSKTTAVRSVALFDSSGHARRADDDVFPPGKHSPGQIGSDVTVDRHGRAVVRETVVPTEPI